MPEQTKKNIELLALKESHLRMLADVIRSSERIENLRRDIGVLGWRMKTLGEIVTKSKPFWTPTTWISSEKSLSRRLTTLENLMEKTAGTVTRFERLTLRRALTAGSPSESE